VTPAFYLIKIAAKQIKAGTMKIDIPTRNLALNKLRYLSILSLKLSRQNLGCLNTAFTSNNAEKPEKYRDFNNKIYLTLPESHYKESACDCFPYSFFSQ